MHMNNLRGIVVVLLSDEIRVCHIFTPNTNKVLQG
ncbi:hypothetical protein MTYP_03028 [Methylophilaceae bacterium]|nr:hypothetical protein MTYP_03028 [Methylophilaceae bacterium]